MPITPYTFITASVARVGGVREQARVERAIIEPADDNHQQQIIRRGGWAARRIFTEGAYDLLPFLRLLENASVGCTVVCIISCLVLHSMV